MYESTSMKFFFLNKINGADLNMFLCGLASILGRIELSEPLKSVEPPSVGGFVDEHG